MPVLLQHPMSKEFMISRPVHRNKKMISTIRKRSLTDTTDAVSETETLIDVEVTIQLDTP